MMDPDATLALSTIDELLEELGRRFESVVVVMDGPTGDPDKCRRWYNGSTFAAIGMCVWAADDLRRNWHDEQDCDHDKDDGED